MPSSPPTTRRQALLTVTGIAAAGLFAPSASRASSRRIPLDLDQPEGNLEGYLKSRGDLSGKTALSWTTGFVYAAIPGRPARALMLAQGLKATRCIKDDSGFFFLERECLIFSDPATGEPLKTWFNPFTERTVEVFHIQNSQAGSHLGVQGPAGPYHMNYMELAGDVTFYDDLFYLRPSELSVAQYPAYVSSDLYQGAGIYHFHARRADLDNLALSSAPVTTSHTGIRQWLPWMEMGAWVGQIVMPSRGRKLPNGISDIPKPLLTWLERQAPEYLEAPTLEQQQEHHTFYGEFKKRIDAQRRSGPST